MGVIIEFEFLFFWTIEVMAELLLITCFDEFFLNLANILLESGISIANGSIWNEESIQDRFISTDNLLTSFRFGLINSSFNISSDLIDFSTNAGDIFLFNCSKTGFTLLVLAVSFTKSVLEHFGNVSTGLFGLE